MKNYNQLSKEEKEKAFSKTLSSLLESICEGAIRFNDALNKDNLQSRIDIALRKANEMQTPWFAGEYILDTCREEIESMTQCDAEDAFYPEAFENIIKLA